MFDLIGETLRRLRKEKGKTLEQLGEEAGLGRGQLSRIENARQEATLSTLAKILQSQGVGRREFFRRYDLVEAEATALRRADGAPGESTAGVTVSNAGSWPEGVIDALSKFQSLVKSTLGPSRPLAQGMIELGDLVVIFRVVPRGAVAEEENEETGEGSP